MIIFSFDVDSVALKTEDSIIEHIEEFHNIKITPKDVTHWGYYTENFPSVINFFSNEKLYEGVKNIKGMDIVIENLIKDFGPNSIQFITSSHSKVKKAKERCLLKNYGHIEDFEKINIIHVGLEGEEGTNHEKHHFTNQTIMIDDAIHNIEDHLNSNPKHKAILVDFGYGWNQNYERKNVYRVKSPEELLNKLLEILEEEK